MKSNRKVLGLFPVIVLSLALLASCSGKTNTANESNSTSMPQNQGSFKQADLYGEVKSISGNEITLSLLEMPQRGQNGFGRGNGQGNGNSSGNNNGNNSNNNNSSSNSNSNNNNSTGDNNSSNNGGGQNDNKGNRGNNPPQGGGFAREKKYTGETATIVISSDTKVSSFGMGRGSSDQDKVTIADIKEGLRSKIYRYGGQLTWYKSIYFT